MLVFVNNIFRVDNIELFRCTSCDLEFQLKLVEKQNNPNYCPNCGTPALLKKVR